VVRLRLRVPVSAIVDSIESVTKHEEAPMSKERSRNWRSPVTFSASAPLSALAVGLICLLQAAGIGCNDSASPTSPRLPTPTPAPAADLSGSWTGTASQSGATDEFFCPPRDYPVTLQITQVRGEVTFRLPLGRGCAKGGEAAFEGVLSGETLSGDLLRAADGDACPLDGGLHGTANSSHLVLTGRLRGTCNELSVHVELIR